MYTMNPASSKLKDAKSEAAHERAILHIRRYMQVMVLLNGLFVVVIGTVCLTLVFQMRKYDAFSSANVNALAENAMTITRNAAAISATAVPIATNAAFLTDAVVATVAAAVNATDANRTATAARAESGGATARHLMAFDPTGGAGEHVVDENDLMNMDLKMRQTVYKLSRELLQTANDKLQQFNPASVSDLLTWVVSGVDYAAVATRFDRVLRDVERTANFGVLATSMLGVAATAANVTVPTTAQLLDAFHTSQAAGAQLSSPQRA